MESGETQIEKGEVLHGEIRLSNIDYNKNLIVAKTDKKLQLQVYLTNCEKSTICKVNLGTNKSNRLILVDTVRMPSLGDNEIIKIYFDDLLIGYITGVFNDFTCRDCNGKKTLPLLNVKLLAWQNDGSNKLLGTSLASIVKHSKRRLKLVNAPFALFEWPETKNIENAQIDIYDDIKGLPKEISIEFLNDNYFYETSNFTQYFKEWKDKDSPFKVYDSQQHEGMLSPFVCVENSTVLRSLYFSSLFTSLDATPYWCFTLIHFNLLLYGLDSKTFLQKMNNEFSITINDDHKIDYMKSINLLKFATHLDKWNRMMNIIILAISNFIVNYFKYSYDSFEGYEGNEIKVYDDERWNSHTLVDEKTYDCEDGAKMFEMIYNLIKTKFGQVFKSDHDYSDDDLKMMKMVSFIMNQYIPMSCVCETCEFSTLHLANEELFAHMGAILFPTKIFLRNIYNASHDQNMEKTNIKDIHSTFEKIQFNDNIVNYDFIPLMAETTVPVFCDPTQVLYEVKPNDKYDEYINLTMKNRMFCYPSGKNVLRNGEYLNFSYNKIIALQTDYFVRENKQIKPTVFYISYNDQPYISFLDLVKQCEVKIPQFRFLYKFDIPKELLHSSNVLMKVFRRDDYFDIAPEFYQHSITDENENGERKVLNFKLKNIFTTMVKKYNESNETNILMYPLFYSTLRKERQLFDTPEHFLQYFEIDEEGNSNFILDQSTIDLNIKFEV